MQTGLTCTVSVQTLLSGRTISNQMYKPDQKIRNDQIDSNLDMICKPDFSSFISQRPDNIKIVGRFATGLLFLCEPITSDITSDQIISGFKW